MTDCAGRLMGCYDVAADQTKTIAACWQAGVYMIACACGNEVTTGRLVVK